MQSATIARYQKIPSAVATKKSRIVFYADAQTKELLERLSEKRNRSVSNLMETLAIKEVEEAQESGEIDPSVLPGSTSIAKGTTVATRQLSQKEIKAISNKGNKDGNPE